MHDRYNRDIVISDLSENNLVVLNGVKWEDECNLAVCFHYITDTVLFLYLPFYSIPVEVLETINHARSFPIMQLHDSFQQRNDNMASELYRVIIENEVYRLSLLSSRLMK
jgi:hypothetical protein